MGPTTKSKSTHSSMFSPGDSLTGSSSLTPLTMLLFAMPDPVLSLPWSALRVSLSAFSFLSDFRSDCFSVTACFWIWCQFYSSLWWQASGCLCTVFSNTEHLEWTEYKERGEPFDVEPSLAEPISANSLSVGREICIKGLWNLRELSSN